MKTTEVLTIFQNIKSIIAGFGSQWLEVCNIEEANNRAAILNWRVEFFENKGVCVKFERENIGYQMPANNDQINVFLKKFEKVLKATPFEMKPKKQAEKQSVIKQPTARQEAIKPKEVKTIATKQPIVKPLEVQPDRQLTEILAKLQAGEYLFQKEVTYLQRHGSPPEGYRYNRFAKLERVRV